MDGQARAERGLERWGLWAGLGLLAAGLAVQLFAYLNHDVAFLAWTAREVAGGAVYGRDILEANLPLAFLIYLPAVPLGEAVGLSAAVKAWTMLLAAGALVLLHRALDPPLRAPVTLAFAIFVAFAFPREFAQREQIALILAAPWCVAAARGRREGVLVGLMAGIGFAIKPHFLLPLALVALYRRRFGAEEKAIVAAGAAYALALVLFFRPFLAESLPLARSAYWAIDPAASGVSRAAIEGLMVAAVAIPILLRRERTAMALLLAGAGFYAAAIVQWKFFPYHFLPGRGFVILAAAALIGLKPRLGWWLTACVSIGLVAQALPWWRGEEGRERQVPQLAALLDRGASFAVIAVHPYPAFPTALHTSACFTGWSNSHWFLPAAAKVAEGEAARRDGVAEEWAVRQAVADLERRPERVVVDPDWRRHTGLRSTRFDALQWLARDADFARLWAGYEEEARVGRLSVYRLRSGPAGGCRRAG